jgi:hypothetical protein
VKRYSVSEEDPLEFRQNNQAQRPFLAHVTRKILTHCATSAPVENMFSNMTLPFNGRRSTLASHRAGVKVSRGPSARNIESLMIGCINTDNTDQASSVLPNILSHYGNDIDGNRLLLHLSMLSDLCHSATLRISVADISEVIQVFNNDAWKQMLPEVINLLRLYLTLPVTIAAQQREVSLVCEDFKHILGPRLHRKDLITLQYCIVIVSSHSHLIWKQFATRLL